MSLVDAIDRLENALVSYFKDKDVPIEIQVAISELEEEMIDAGLSPLSKEAR